MGDSTLWAIALGIGLLGLVLVVVAGVAAVSASVRARRSREVPPAPDPQSQAAPADVRSDGVGGGWLWLKAGVFAVIHAGAVSFVLGGLTFFEDIARASEEIRTTGVVTFPKRLLPESLTGPEASLPLSRSSDELLARPNEQSAAANPEPANSGQPDPPDPDGADWEVVGVLTEDAVEPSAET